MKIEKVSFDFDDLPKYHLLIATVPLKGMATSRAASINSPLVECKTACPVDFMNNKVGSQEDCQRDERAYRFNF